MAVRISTAIMQAAAANFPVVPAETPHEGAVAATAGATAERGVGAKAGNLVGAIAPVVMVEAAGGAFLDRPAGAERLDRPARGGGTLVTRNRRNVTTTTGRGVSTIEAAITGNEIVSAVTAPMTAAAEAGHRDRAGIATIANMAAVAAAAAGDAPEGASGAAATVVAGERTATKNGIRLPGDERETGMVAIETGGSRAVATVVAHLPMKIG